jgi:hypothetical protein
VQAASGGGAWGVTVGGAGGGTSTGGRAGGTRTVRAAAGPFTLSCWPTRIAFAVTPGFATRSACTVVPSAAAMLPSVSPALTVYVLFGALACAAAVGVAVTVAVCGDAVGTWTVPVAVMRDFVGDVVAKRAGAGLCGEQAAARKSRARERRMRVHLTGFAALLGSLCAAPPFWLQVPEPGLWL